MVTSALESKPSHRVDGGSRTTSGASLECSDVIVADDACDTEQQPEDWSRQSVVETASGRADEAPPCSTSAAATTQVGGIVSHDVQHCEGNNIIIRQTGDVLQHRSLPLDMTLEKEYLLPSAAVDACRDLPEFEGNVSEGLASDQMRNPIKLNVESLSAFEETGISMFIGSNALDTDEESSNPRAASDRENVEFDSVPEQSDNVVNVSHVSRRSCDDPVSSVMDNKGDENSNLSICESSTMEDFSMGNSLDQMNLVSMTSVAECLAGNEAGSCVQPALPGSASKSTELAGRWDVGQLEISKEPHECAGSNTPCGAGACVEGTVVEENVSLRGPAQPGTPPAPTDERACDARHAPASWGRTRSSGVSEAESTSGVSTSTLSTPDTHQTSSRVPDSVPGPSQSVQHFLNEFSKCEDCVWTIKTMAERQWVFQFLFTSLELVLELEPENNNELSKCRTITDVFLNSRITEKTDPLAHLVHYIILKQFPVDSLRSSCSTTADVPIVLKQLSTEVHNLTVFMLEFDKLEKTGQLMLREKCVIMRFSDLELRVLFNVTVDLANWGSISEEDVSTSAVVGLVREEDIKQLACTVAQGQGFLSRYIVAIDDYLRHLATFNK